MTSSELKSLAKEMLCEGKELRIKAFGGSMLPLFRAGDEFIIESVDLQKIKIGDTLIVQQNEQLILHRLHKLLPNKRLILWGDFNRKPDEVCSFDQIFAVATRFNRNGKVINIDTYSYKFLGKSIVWMSPISHYFLFYTVVAITKLKKIITSRH